MNDTKRKTRFQRVRSLFFSYSLLLPLAGGIVLFGGNAPVQADDSGLDVILRSGTVIDGSGAPRYVADVGVADGHITQIGDLSDLSAETEIDATGLVVAPGFIDVHSHAELDAIAQAKSSLTQGVTTEIRNPDGGGPVNLSEMLSSWEKNGLGINIGAYIGFNSLWKETVGLNDRRATDEEIARMRALVERGMQDGAWGASLGLEYTPANFADTDEVIDVVSAARQWRTNTQSHVRNEDVAVVKSVAEHMEIGEKTGLVPLWTHAKVVACCWGQTGEALKHLDQANARGTYAAGDQYPYGAYMSSTTSFVPKWVLDGGREAYLARFADPQLRPQIEQEMIEQMKVKVGEAKNSFIVPLQRTLADIADEMGVSPGEANMRLLEEQGVQPMIGTFGSEEDIRRIMQHPLIAIASDGGASTAAMTHPRHYGTQPRVLGRYVREQGVLSLEEAIRKMTGLPATQIGMVDRGYLAPGMVADITVFDPDTIIDRATFEQPKQYAEGVEHVIVNGKLALTDGELTGQQAGKALRRDSSMISRPETGPDPVRASANGCVHPLGTDQADPCPVQVAFNAASDDGPASGTLVVNHKELKTTFRATQLGRLQVTDDWATITGRGKVAGEDQERSFLVILDRKDTLENNRTTITIRIQNAYTLKGVLSTGDSRVDTGEGVR